MTPNDFDPGGAAKALPSSTPRQSRGKTWLPLSIPILVGIMVVLGGLAVRQLWFTSTAHENETAPRAVTPRGDLAQDEKSTIELYDQAKLSVVHITTLAERRSSFTLNVQQVPEGTGSGFIWDDAGHIVTNFHVIRNADAALVTLWDHASYKATLVGAFADKDLAVLRIEAPKERLRPIPVGTSDDLRVGQKAFAIGNPFGLDQTLTTGIVSAVGREIESVTRRPIKNVIQTDAAINPGNSGGPLLDSAGRLIGVNTAIYSPSGASSGIGFAIPVDEVNRVVPQLIRKGKVTRPGIGVGVASDQQARQAGIRGVVITDVTADSPAARAGLRGLQRDDDGRVVVGDVIIAIDNEPITKLNDLYSALEKRQVGETVKVRCRRNGRELEMTVTLTALD